MNVTSKSFLSFACVGSLLALSTAARATPTLEPSCSRSIHHPPDSTGVLFDDDCQTVYVNPPVTGTARAVAVSPTAAVQFCPAYLDAGTVASRTTDGAKILADRIVHMIQDFTPLQGEVDDLGRQLAAAKAEKAKTSSALEAAKKRKEEIISEIKDAKNSYETCSALSSSGPCQNDLQTWNAAKESLRRHIADEFLPAQRAADDADAEFARLSELFASRTSRLAEALTPLFDLQARLQDVNDRVFESFLRYSSLEGATGQLTYTIPWDRLLDGYRSLNPGVNFQPMPIVDGSFSATAYINNTPSAVTALLAYDVPGVKAGGKAAPLTGLGVLRSLGGSPDTSSPRGRLIPFGTSASAQIVLSLAGACPYYANGLPEGPSRDLDDLTAHVVSNLHYTYEVKARRSYTARYNLSSWLSHIETQTKRGGLFSSKVLHDIQEDGNSTDWFGITFDQTAAGFGYTDQEKQNITKEVKGQLMERALALVAQQNGMLPGRAPEVPSLAPTGAGVAAGYLLQGCGFWSWCTVGGWALSTLDSIFGRSEATSNFHRNNNVWVEDRVVDNAVLLRPGSLTFQRP